MDPTLKIVTRLPLEELWRGKDFSTTARGRWLAGEDIRGLLRADSVQFVVVDLGKAPLWIEIDHCYNFWKQEIKLHLAEGSRIVLEEFPGEYCYSASQWENRAGEPPIVVLEKHH